MAQKDLILLDGKLQHTSARRYENIAFSFIIKIYFNFVIESENYSNFCVQF